MDTADAISAVRVVRILNSGSEYVEGVKLTCNCGASGLYLAGKLGDERLYFADLDEVVTCAEMTFAKPSEKRIGIYSACRTWLGADRNSSAPTIRRPLRRQTSAFASPAVRLHCSALLCLPCSMLSLSPCYYNTTVRTLLSTPLHTILRKELCHYSRTLT